jgi:peptidoglycan/LPS O-acetylase OafA/YrhL
MMWPFAWWFAWTLGAVAAEAYTGAIRLPRWCSSYVFATLLAVAAVGCNRIILQRLSLRYSGTLEGIAHRIGVADLRLPLVVLSGLSDFLFALTAFVLLNRWIRDEQLGAFRSRSARLLGTIGLMSYSLYLIHMPILHLIEGTIPFGTGWGSTAVRFAVMVPLCLAAAMCFYLAVERHFLNKQPAAKPTAGKIVGEADITSFPTEPVVVAR